MTTTAETLIERAHTLAAEIVERAREIDSASKLPDDIVKKFVDLELVSTLTPKRFGGHEFDLKTAVEIVRIIGTADMAAAWVLGFYIGHNWIHAQFPEQAQKEIFANGPAACSAGVLAPTLKLKAVEGGYRVSGRNGWNSGSPHADWILGAGMVIDGDPKQGPLTFIVPQKDVQLVDTWDVQGMRATGSWDVVYDDVFVPAHRTVPAIGLMFGKTPGGALHENPLYTRPLVLISFTYSMAAFVGVLRGASDEFNRLNKSRMTTHDRKPVNEKVTVQMCAGRGAANARIVEILLDELTALVASPEGQALDVPGRLAFKARSAALVTMCRDAVNDLVLGAGASSFRTDSRLQTMFRNLNMVSIHAFWNNDSSMEAYGRVLLGMEPNGLI